MREIPIIRFPYSCYRCGETVYVTWPFNEEITSPLPLSLVDAELCEKEYSDVRPTNGDGYTTTCPDCGARQGEFYIRTEAMHEAYTREPYDHIQLDY